MDRSEPALSPWRVSVAPMMAWTDRHCRHFHRLITRKTRLYTEMVTTGALLHGDVPKHLRHDAAFEHPTALQIGGSEPVEMAHAARLAVQWGYDEVNLNCGCPSERVQRGAFGACLMNEASLVADGVKAMLDAVGGDIPVTVKHRIGIDRIESYGFVRDFVGTVAEAGCTVFIVHARNAWLQGLSPKENREIPPLRYEIVHRLKQEFPSLTVAINGGITTSDQVAEHLASVDGVMVGRAAYHDPLVMADWDERFWGEGSPNDGRWSFDDRPASDADAGVDPHAGDPAADPAGDPAGAGPTRAGVRVIRDDWRLHLERRMVAYIEQEAAAHGTPWAHAATHMLGLWNGRPGARLWRRVWSDHRLKNHPVREVHEQATAARLASTPESRLG